MPSVRTEAELLERLWSRVAPLIPPSAAKPKGGRPRHDDRACLAGIVYVLRNGVRWRDLPSEYPSGPTCWRRHAAWTALGIWAEIWSVAVEELDAAGLLGTDELFADATFVPAQKGASKSGKPRLAKAVRLNSSPTPTASRSASRQPKPMSPSRN
jgi:transposase